MPDAHDPHDLPTLPLPESGDEDDFGAPAPQDVIQLGKRPPTDGSADDLPLDATAPHARVTMPGTGGLDPNPDFAARRSNASVPNTPASTQDDFNAGFTVPHVVPFEHTLVHVPGETAPQRPPTQNAPPRQPIQPTIPAPYPPQRTANTNYNPNTQPNISPGGQNYPAPPGYGGQTQPNAPYNAPQGYRPPTMIPPNAGQPSGQGLPPRRSRRRGCLGCSPGCLIAFFGVFVTFCGGLTLITLTLTATLGAELENRLSGQIASVGDYENFQSTFFYDRNQTLLYESFNEGRRINANTADFPQDLIDATIATEDDTFRTNPGFEVEATLRAFLQYVNLAPGSSGGSTISQQLVRNVLFEPEYRAERSVQRKFEEILLAYMLNRQLSKDEILTLYLNEIYYGNLAYGAQAASQTFFNKSVSDLTLGEAALIAGLPQAPANLDPFSDDPDVLAAVEQRWRTVLDRMVISGYTTDDERNAALRDGYSLVEPEAPLRAPHFTVYAQRQYENLMESLGYTPEDIARGGMRVYTTLDLQINNLAEQVAQDQVAGIAGNNVNNASVMVLQPVTGQILAMIGSVDYNNENIDGRVNVAVSLRQPGSTMKAFTYAAAMEMGMTPGDIIWDTETDIDGYRPNNYDNIFHGPVRMRSALANSYNIPAVQTLRGVGIENYLAFLQRFGVSSLGNDASQYGWSLTLGGGDITLLELTRGYSVFANGGAYVGTTPILCVLNGDNEIIFQYENGCPRGDSTENTVNREGYGTQVLDARIAYLIGDILADDQARLPAFGSNNPLELGNVDASVKTGTTNDYRDNWTVGYTRNVAVGVWVGNTRGEPMIGSTGVTGAAPIWNAVMRGIYNNPDMLASFANESALLSDRLDVPQGMSTRQMCALAALREPSSPDCTSSLTEWFLDGPAGIPDGQGGIGYPQPNGSNMGQPPASGPYLYEIEPDIFRALVHPIPPEIGNGIQFAVDPGQPVPPAPLYCQVPVELASSDPTAREGLFIAPPPDPADAARAEQYARGAGYAFLPTIACDANLIGASGGGGGIFVTAYITSPSGGAVVPAAPFDILGTASFNQNGDTYYRVDIRGGQWGDWTTIGDIGYSPIVDGVLYSLPALPPGQYALQLVVVANGNFVQTPYQVDFFVQ